MQSDVKCSIWRVVIQLVLKGIVQAWPASDEHNTLSKFPSQLPHIMQTFPLELLGIVHPQGNPASELEVLGHPYDRKEGLTITLFGTRMNLYLYSALIPLS